MKIGYMRVSKFEQNEALQEDALNKAGCEKLFLDKMSGKDFDRQGLDNALSHLRQGDTFVIWKLDRLGRSLKELVQIVTDLEKRGVEFVVLVDKIDTSTPGGKLMFHVMAALAEYEREMIVQRTKAGLDAARARGRMGGRPRAMSKHKEITAQAMYNAGSYSIEEICQTVGVSKSTLYRYIETEQQAEESEKDHG